MAKPITVRTLENMTALCVEEGDCLLWTGYQQNGAPQVYDGTVGKMVSARGLMLKLSGEVIKDTTRYYANTCKCKECVAPAHTIQQTDKQHAVSMGKLVDHNAPTRILKLQMSHYAISKRRVSDEAAAKIAIDPRSGPVIAAEHGISRSMVARFKNGKSRRIVSAQVNPWAGLMR